MSFLRHIWEWIRPPRTDILAAEHESERVTNKANRALAERKRLDLVRESAARAGGRFAR